MKLPTPPDQTLRYTLVGEGSTDQALVPVIDWLLFQHSLKIFQPQWGDIRHLPRPPRGLKDKIRVALDLYPADLLFVHRDSDGQPRGNRLSEIRAALPGSPPAVCVVPICMTEAWFLFDEVALRRAADNPNGKTPLNLPRIGEVENKPDPKGLLNDLLKLASELHGHRLKQFHLPTRLKRLAESIDDFSPLRRLSAFASFEKDLKAVLLAHRWAR